MESNNGQNGDAPVIAIDGVTKTYQMGEVAVHAAVDGSLQIRVQFHARTVDPAARQAQLRSAARPPRFLGLNRAISGSGAG